MELLVVYSVSGWYQSLKLSYLIRGRQCNSTLLSTITTTMRRNKVFFSSSKNIYIYQNMPLLLFIYNGPIHCINPNTSFQPSTNNSDLFSLNPISYMWWKSNLMLRVQPSSVAFKISCFFFCIRITENV